MISRTAMKRVGSSSQGELAKAMVLAGLRAKRGLTLAIAGQKANCSDTLLSRIENSHERPPKGQRLYQILEAYGVSPKYYEQLVSKQEKELLDESKIKQKIVELLNTLPPKQLDAVYTIVSGMTSK